MSTFDYRRRLETKELLMLAGGAAGASAAVATGLFYVGRLWLQRVRLKPKGDAARPTGPGPDPLLRALAEKVARAG
jgi:hypothetical protein